MNLRTGIAAATVALALAPAASLAVDGVILIDQNKALAGNVTAGDAPGYPIMINTPGSYRLSGNLTVPAGVNGIVFATDGVTLDLNGFAISGPPGQWGLTDASAARSRVTIRNGQVIGFSNSVRLAGSDRVVVEDMLLEPEQSGIAIVVGGFSRVSRNSVVGNGLIQVTCPSIVTENITDGFVSVVVLDTTKQCIRYHNRSLTHGNAINE
jgi:hypothetical protein